MNIPKLCHRERIQTFCAEEAERLGHTVLLLPIDNPFVIPRIMPNGFKRKDREGRVLRADQLVAFDPTLAFDGAAGLSLSFNENDGRVGVHHTELPGNYIVDVMSKEPNKVYGEGYAFIVDGTGWVAENHDPLLTTGARFRQHTGEISLLGVGVMGLDDLSVPVRRVADPPMEHYRTPVPIAA